MWSMRFPLKFILLSFYRPTVAHVITMKVHHRGEITFDPNMPYESGLCQSFEHMDVDHISSIVVGNLVKYLGYPSFKCLWYRHVASDGSVCFSPLSNDEDVREFFENVKGVAEVDIYVEHLVEDPNIVPLIAYKSAEDTPEVLQVGSESDDEVLQDREGETETVKEAELVQDKDGQSVQEIQIDAKVLQPEQRRGAELEQHREAEEGHEKESEAEIIVNDEQRRSAELEQDKEAEEAHEKEFEAEVVVNDGQRRGTELEQDKEGESVQEKEIESEEQIRDVDDNDEVTENDKGVDKGKRKASEVLLSDEDEDSDAEFDPNDEEASSDFSMDDSDYEEDWDWLCVLPKESLLNIAEANPDPTFAEGSTDQYTQAVNESRNLEPSTYEEFEDEDGDSEDLESPSESDDEGKSRRKYPKFKPTEDGEVVHLELGLTFNNKDQFKDAVSDFAIQTKKNLTITKNDKKRMVVKCVKECPFYLRASKTPSRPIWQIVSFHNNHNCCRTASNRQAKTFWLAKKFMQILKHTLDLKVRGLIEEARVRWGIVIGRYKACRAKVKSLEMLHGASVEQYSHLMQYAAELLRSNPGSTVIIKSAVGVHGPVFERIYICFQATKTAFAKHCRPLIGLDGCFLKGLYGGQLLSAVGKDGNNQMFPVAFAVVEAETKDSWTYESILIEFMHFIHSLIHRIN
ncbi:uncharacterized protein LOC130740575 [Lotus japonicus]|uniref:uncharacterized protein LOC130740575 n=1 Tax=Lotus japonicus TaxID=34305 RepID=UPI00258B73CF|nr:uncharacterized protein LOC130740575 [Lotus japonicus]